MARTNKANTGKSNGVSNIANNNGAFKHNTSIGENNEILYDAPIEIRDQADMRNYGITIEDCRYLHFGSSEKMRVYFFKTTNRAFAEEQWEYINNKHSSGYFHSRCMVPGKRKKYIRCRDTNKCSECPYGITPETRQAADISWDNLVENGWETEAEAEWEESVERKAIAKTEYEKIRKRMDTEDVRIAQAFEAKVLFGDSVKKIALDLGVSEPRVYQLIARAKAIGREYRQ